MLTPMGWGVVDNDVNTQGVGWVGGYGPLCERDCYGAQYHQARDCRLTVPDPDQASMPRTLASYSPVAHSLSNPAVGNSGLTCLYVARKIGRAHDITIIQ